MVFFKTLAMHITFRTIVFSFSVLSLLAVGCLSFVRTNNTPVSLLVIISKILVWSKVGLQVRFGLGRFDQL
jgi:hypothetical protein